MIQSISVRDISRDQSFRFSDTVASDLLVRSVKEAGVLCPVAVAGRPGSYTLIAGFSRVSAAAKTCVQQVPARVKPGDFTLAEFFIQELEVHATARTFTLTEKARVLHILERLPRSSSLNNRVCSLLDVPGEKHIQKEITELLAFSPAVQSYISEYGLSLKQCSMFQGLSEPEQEHVIAMARNLSIRGVELRKILELIQHVAGKNGQPVIEVIESCTDTSDGNVPENRNRALKEMKENLMWKVYPLLKSTNRDLHALSREFKGGKLVTLDWDDTLERPGIWLNASVSSPEDVEKVTEILADRENKRSLEMMITAVES